MKVDGEERRKEDELALTRNEEVTNGKVDLSVSVSVNLQRTRDKNTRSVSEEGVRRLAS